MIRFLPFILLLITGQLWAQSYYNDYSNSQKSVVHEEQFNYHVDGWNNGDGTSTVREVKNGYFRYKNKKDNTGQIYGKEYRFDQNRDWEIEANIKIAYTPYPSTGHCLTWGSDKNTEYDFYINQNQKYMIDKYDDNASSGNKFQKYKDWTYSNYISKYDYNRLTVRKVGSRMYFFINKQKVHEMSAQRFAGDYIRFCVGKGSTIHVDDFKVLYLQSSNSYASNNNASRGTGNYSSYNGLTSNEKQSIFMDDFNNNNKNWTTGSNSNRDVSIRNGNYFLSHKRHQGDWQMEKSVFGIDFSRDNFQVETKIDLLATAKTEELNGMCIGNGSKRLLFGKNRKGKYKIAISDNGYLRTIKDWTFSNGVDSYGRTILTIRKVNGTYYFFANKVFVYSTSNININGNKVGFRVTTNTEAEYDFMYVHKITGGGTNNNTVSSSTPSYSSGGGQYNTYSGVSKNAIFIDDFVDNRKNWTTGSNSNRDVSIRNGNYFLSHKRHQGEWQMEKSISGIDFSRDNFQVETKIDLLATAKTEELNGMCIGNGSKRLLFGKNRKSKYKIAISDNGYIRTIKDWTFSNGVDSYGKTILTIRKVNGTYYFFANKVFVYSTSNINISGNKVGFNVTTNTEAEYDFMYVHKITGGSTSNNTYSSTPSYSNNNNSGGSYSSYSSISGKKNALFIDDFVDNRKSWSVGSTSDRDAYVRNGNYFFSHKRHQGGWKMWNTVSGLDYSRDNFQVETKIDLLATAKTEELNGMFIGTDTKDIRFGINRKGKYKIAVSKNGNWTTIKDWTFSKGVDSYGRTILTIRKVNGTYYFFANKVFLYSTTINGISGNRFGFRLTTNTEAEYDFMYVHKINVAGGSNYTSSSSTTTTSNNTSRNYKTEPYHKNYQRTIVHQELFNQSNSNWEGTSSTVTREITNGYFRYKNTDMNDAKVFGRQYYFNENRDWEIETNINMVASNTQSTGQSITWGSDKKSEYDFFIAKNGEFFIDKYEHSSGGYSYYKKRTNTGAVLASGYNKLTIRKIGNYYYFYINGQQVHGMPFESFFGHYLRYTVGANSVIYVNDFKISYLSGSNGSPLSSASSSSIPLSSIKKITVPTTAGKWQTKQVLYNENGLKVEVQFKMYDQSCSMPKANKYRYYITGTTFSHYQVINWDLKFKDCNGNLITRKEELVVGGSGVVTGLVESMDYTFTGKAP